VEENKHDQVQNDPVPEIFIVPEQLVEENKHDQVKPAQI
jgi:hypothetical protein